MADPMLYDYPDPLEGWKDQEPLSTQVSHTSSTSTTIDISQITYILYTVVVKLVANQQTLSKNGVGEGHPASATPTENPSKTPKLPF